MQIKDIEKVGTAELLSNFVQLAKGSWAFGALAGFCLTFLAVKKDSLDVTDKILLSLLVFGCGAFIWYQHWWITKKAIPALKHRCSNIPIPESTVDSTAPFRRQQRLSKLGLYFFLFSIPVFFLAAILGYSPFNESGAPTIAGWAIIAAFVVPGLYLLLKGAQCPSCKKLIHASYGNITRCPHCGAKLRDDV